MSQSYLHLSHLLPHLGLVLQLFLPEETRGANWFNVRSSFVKHWLYFEEMICKCELIAVLPDIFQLNQMLCLCCQQQPPHFIITCFHLKREVESEQKNELRGERRRRRGRREGKRRRREITCDCSIMRIEYCVWRDLYTDDSFTALSDTYPCGNTRKTS